MLLFEKSSRGILHSVLFIIIRIMLFLLTAETFESYAEQLQIDWTGWIGLSIIFTYIGLWIFTSFILARIISYSIIKH